MRREREREEEKKESQPHATVIYPPEQFRDSGVFYYVFFTDEGTGEVDSR